MKYYKLETLSTDYATIKNGSVCCPNTNCGGLAAQSRYRQFGSGYLFCEKCFIKFKIIEPEQNYMFESDIDNFEIEILFYGKEL